MSSRGLEHPPKVWHKSQHNSCVTTIVTDKQSLSQRSKTRTSVADPGSASGGTFQCMQFLPFFIYFSYLFYLGHLSLLGLQTKTRRQRNSSTSCSFKSHNLETFMSSAASAFVHATRKRSQKVPRAKSGTFWFPWMDSHDSMIQVPFNSSCVVLQYKTGTKFFHRAVPKLHTVKNSTKIAILLCTFTYKPMTSNIVQAYIAASYQRPS